MLPLKKPIEITQTSIRLQANVSNNTNNVNSNNTNMNTATNMKSRDARTESVASMNSLGNLRSSNLTSRQTTGLWAGSPVIDVIALIMGLDIGRTGIKHEGTRTSRRICYDDSRETH